MKKFSVIIPVYNRPAEVRDLLESLAAQTDKGFEAVIVEDGSTEPCADVVARYDDAVDVKYFAKHNEGRSIARNHGMERATGDYYVFFDSDCVIPPAYFATLRGELEESPVDCYGGPDAAHESFTPVQKAINYAMTAFLTTGGIRGGKVQMEKFVPRTFNMGFSRTVYDRVGGFREMFSEDIDMSTRISRAGFTTRLVRSCPVWHKRRVSLRKFWKQVHVFGQSRITLQQLYPGSLKPVHALPALAVIGAVALVALAVTVSPWFLLPFALYFGAIFIGAWRKERSLKVACLAIPAAAIQIAGYGSGFIRAYTWQVLLGHGRDVAREIEIRKGANE